MNPVCPHTGLPLERGVRPLALTYKGLSITVDMPGWYREGEAEGLHSHEDMDMEISDRALSQLKARSNFINATIGLSRPDSDPDRK